MSNFTCLKSNVPYSTVISPPCSVCGRFDTWLMMPPTGACP